jgi:site-specific DNA recombinase
MRAAIYLRQSRDVTGEGHGVDRQRADCEALCALRGWTVDSEHVYVDNDVSASNGKARPEYSRMLEQARAGAFDVIVAWHVDRLTRTMSDLEVLLKLADSTGVKIATVNGDLDLTNDSGKLVGRILAAVASGEVERKSVRQRRANLQAATNGRPPLRQAFGYTPDGLSIDPDKADAVREVFARVLAGSSLVAVTRWLNEQGHRTTRGGEWKRSNVRWLLLNPRYAGQRLYNGEEIGPGSWPALVAEETFYAVRALLTDPKRKKNHGTARRWLGAGLYRCGVCNGKADVRVNYRGTGERIYRCRALAHLSRLADPVDRFVSDVIAARLARPDVADLLAASDDPAARRLHDETVSVRARLDALAADYADGMLTARQVQISTDRLNGKLAELEQQQARIGRRNALAAIVSKRDPAQAWRDADVSIRREVVDVLATVTLHRGKPGRFDPNTVSIEWKKP